MLQFFPTAEESINYYNQKRCVDGKGLILPSQIVSTIHVIFCGTWNSKSSSHFFDTAVMDSDGLK